MKALTVRQPWAWAMFNLDSECKDIENRDWFQNIKGDVAIHAAKGMTKAEYFYARDFVQIMFGIEHAQSIPAPKELERGMIVGVVEIVGCVKRHESPWFVGKYGFVLTNPRPLARPIEVTGQLGFWDVPADIVATEIIPQVGSVKPEGAFIR